MKRQMKLLVTLTAVFALSVVSVVPVAHAQVIDIDEGTTPPATTTTPTETAPLPSTGGTTETGKVPDTGIGPADNLVVRNILVFTIGAGLGSIIGLGYLNARKKFNQ